MLSSVPRFAKVAAAMSAGLASLALAGPALAAPRAVAAHSVASHSAASPAPRFRARVVINGAKLWHSYRSAGSSTWKKEHLTSPDDITVIGHHLFTAFQNGVGPQGQASPDGNTDSTVVEFTAGGRVIRQWELHGKCDGMTADTQFGILIATVNEDAHSSIYTIIPAAPGRRSGRSLPLQP